MLKDIRSGIIISITFLLIVGLVGVSYSALSSLKASNGETLSVSKWDSLVDHSVPSGAINAFYLASCPIGWKAADGTNSTPDLRGQFLRGLNDFGSDAGTRSDGNQDPNGGSRTLGDYQADQLISHNHSYNAYKWVGSGGSYTTPGAGATVSHPGHSTLNAGGAETRPKNVSVIFCVKE